MAKAWIPVGAGRYRLVDTSATAVASRADAPFIRPEHLSPKARRDYYLQTGKQFDSESALRAHLRDNGLRREESGEPNHAMRKEDRKWLRDTKRGEREKNPQIGFRGYHTMKSEDRT